MLNFPVPYPDELVYSAVARAGVHAGIVSPKQLLDDVFKDRHVIATVDLPNHLKNIARNFPDRLGFCVEHLAYRHTLFPVYAPFTTESRRNCCLAWMASNSREAIHLTLGLAASRIKQNRFIRYCPVCLNQMLDKYGEYYWSRRWQIAGVDCCLEHGDLIDTNLERHSHHRHQFVSASPSLCPKVDQRQSSTVTRLVTFQVNRLLDLKPSLSASVSQWSAYYRKLASLSGCNRGQQIEYDAIKERVLEYWPTQWLARHGLAITDGQSCWLRSIFRKHRKSFSYLEHIVVLSSFLPERWCIGQVLDEVGNMSESPVQSKPEPKAVSVSMRSARRKSWLRLVRSHEVKEARQNGGGYLYAWLYRYDKGWLLSTNRQYRTETAVVQTRVNWHARDVAVARQLIRIRHGHEQRLHSPRWSRNWFLSKLDQASTVEKNISRLPTTNLFFQKYCESVSDYQVRRITNVISSFDSSRDELHRWRVLRMSGLSEERLTNSAKSILEKVVDY